MKKLKKIVEKVPYPLGHLLALVPFSWRLGKVYTEFSQKAMIADSWSDEERERYTVGKFAEVFRYAVKKFRFYDELYRKHGLAGLEIKSMADIRRLPIITKADIRECLSDFSGVYKLNTGGTTGTPFAFYVDKAAWAREWAHMHHIWRMIGYDYRDPSLALRGRNIGDRNIIYNPIHNEFLLNTYCGLKDFSKELEKLLDRHPYFYVHGYPSSIYNFLCEAEQILSSERLAEITAKLRGLLLHSEFPYDYMKEKFAKYGLRWISWYGHSEMCILACDPNCDNRYHPLPTYGLAEVEDGHLIGSSFHNFDMPLLRYDTGDLVKELAATPGGVCREFSVTEGRNADFIEDRNGKPIPLTSLIFGRHHRAFDYADHIQIHQENPGEATIYLITKREISEKLEDLFELSYVDISFKLAVREKAQLSSAGKLRLKI